MTDVPGVILTTTHGDCIPIYAYDPVKKVVGLAHAGWRGTWEFDGGAFMNQASHYVDLLEWIVGPIESLQAYTATLARDIAYMKDEYTVEEAIPFDMFPRTGHVECVVLMSKTNT